MYEVTYLQAVEPEALDWSREGIELQTDGVRDSMGFPRVDVKATTREGLLAYIREFWGDDDPKWFAEYVEARVEESHSCDQNATYVLTDGALGHGYECGICGRFLQAG